MKEELLIENFKILGGKHCQTTALLHLLNHRGLKLSEDMLFGLGGGIGFIYWYMKLMLASLKNQILKCREIEEEGFSKLKKINM